MVVRLLPVLLAFSWVASGEQAIQNGVEVRPALPAWDNLLAGGLTPAAAGEIQSDLSNKAFSKAEAQLIAQINNAPNPQALLEILGKVFFLDSNYFQAAVAYKKAEKYGVLSDNARFTLVMSYVELKRTKWARDELLRLIKDRPRQALYRYWLGRLDYDDQRFADGIVSFNQAIETDPGFVRAYDGRGLCEEAIGAFESAEQSYARANTLNRQATHKYASPPLDYGAMLAKLERYSEATSLFKEALAIDPSRAKAHYELGRVEEQSSDLKTAIVDYQEAAKLDPKDTSAVYALARVYTKTNEKELAAAMMARFRALKAQATSGRETQ